MVEGPVAARQENEEKKKRKGRQSCGRDKDGGRDSTARAHGHTSRGCGTVFCPLLSSRSAGREREQGKRVGREG